VLTEKKILNETKNHNPKGGAFQVKWSVPNLSFEKTQNMIMKQILGVHGKTPNLAIHAANWDLNHCVLRPLNLCLNIITV
jgi:hypothetical protein